MRVTHVFSSPVADATGTLTVWAGSTTASAIATDMVRPTNWNSAHGLVQDIGGNTLGVSSVSGSNIVLAGGANITLSGVQGANVGSVTIIGGTGEVGTGTTFGGTNISGSMTLNSAGLALSLSGGAGGGGATSAGAFAQSNTTLSTSGTLPLSSLMFAGAGAASVGVSNGSVVISAPNPSAGNVTFSAGTASAGLASVVFSNSNGVSFGLNGSTITGTVATNYAGQGFTSTTTAGTAIVGTLSTNGLSVGVPAFLTTARRSTDGIGLNTAQTNVTWTVNSSGLSLNAAGYAGTGTTFGGTNISGSITQNSNGIALSLSGLAALTSQSNQALSAANGSFTFQTAQFSNANGVSFVTSAGSAIAASVNTAYVGLNTAQTNVTWTVNSSGISLNAAGYAGTGTTFNGANISGSITQNSVGLNLSLSVAAPGAANINVSAGTTSNNVTQIVFSNSNGVTFGLNGSTITASAAGGAGGGGTLNYFANFIGVIDLNQPVSLSVSQSTSMVVPFTAPLVISADFARLIVLMTTNSTTRATSANVAISMSRFSTLNAVVYALGTGASSASLVSVASGSALSGMAFSLSGSGSEYTVSQSLTYPTRGGSSLYTTTYGSTETHYAIHTSNLTAFSGRVAVDVPFANTLPASGLWFASGMEVTVYTSNNAAWSNWAFTIRSLGCVSNSNFTLGILGVGEGDTPVILGQGFVSSNVVGTLAEIPITNISSGQSNRGLHFQLMRS